MRILVVEDELKLRHGIVLAAAEVGFAADGVGTLSDALAVLATGEYDVVVLDLALPDGTGMDILQDLRCRKRATPVIILTARDAIEDRVQGLDLGADDYLVKPFAMIELLARMRALMRRPSGVLGRRLQIGKVDFDTVSRVVTIGGTPVILPRQELGTLECLMRHAGRVVAKDVLIDQVYGMDDQPTANAIPVHIHHLRRKLDSVGAAVEIVTLRGLGYLLRAQPEIAPS